MVRQINDYFLYRWRYLLGYTSIGILVASLLVIAGLYIPGGITTAEMESVVTSNALSIDSFQPTTIVNLPYHLLQRASIELLGVSTLSIKLPSLILGAFAILGMFILLRSWFRRNVAVITTILVITTGQLLFVAQNGTAGILYLLWSVWLLVAATMVSRQAKSTTLWKIVLFGVGALSLYTPLSLYIVLALLSATVLHPHLRFLVRRLSRPKLAIAGVCALILVAPLIYALVRQPSLVLTLLGIPSTIPDVWGNAVTLLKQYFDFVTPSSSTLMTPMYGLGSMALIILGIFRLVTTKYTAQSYLISAWIILLLPVLLINPSFTSVSFLPILLLMAMGMNALISNWYSLFPRNPYARIAGLIPLAVLIGGMVFTGVDRYTYGYLYDPNTASNFSKDVTLLNKALSKTDRGSTSLVVGGSELAFYTVVVDKYEDVTIGTTPSPAKTIIASHSAYKSTKIVGQLDRIVTDTMSQNSDRFYIYKTSAK
jgi:hypothetical protein